MTKPKFRKAQVVWIMDSEHPAKICEVLRIAPGDYQYMLDGEGLLTARSDDFYCRCPAVQVMGMFLNPFPTT